MKKFGSFRHFVSETLLSFDISQNGCMCHVLSRLIIEAFSWRLKNLTFDQDYQEASAIATGGSSLNLSGSKSHR